MPSIHSVLVFVSIKHLPISEVEMQEQFLFRQVGPRDCRMFQYVVRYGYKDVFEEAKEFKNSLIEQLKQFVHHEYFLKVDLLTKVNLCTRQQTLQALHLIQMTPSTKDWDCPPVQTEETLKPQNSPNFCSRSIHYRISKCSTNSSGIAVVQIPSVENEKQFIQKEMERGVMYLMGETEVVAENNSSIIKKVVVNNIFNFMRREFRQGEKALSISVGQAALGGE